MFRVIIGNVTIANLPDRKTAAYFAQEFGGIIKRIRYKNPKVNYFPKANKTEILHEELAK